MAKHKKKQKTDASLNKVQQGAQETVQVPEPKKQPETKKQGKKTKQKAAAAKTPAVFASRAVFGWVVAMSTVFPLIWDDYYFNILETKYMTLIMLTLALFAVMLVWGLASGSLFRRFRMRQRGSGSRAFSRGSAAPLISRTSA